MIAESAVRALAAWRGDPVVTSFYLDVDGRRYPRRADYAPHAHRLFRIARARAERRGRGVAKAVESDTSRIEDWLEGVDRASTRGVAAFSCASGRFFEACVLPVPVRDQVALGPGPDVAPLCAVLAAADPCLVAAVDSRGSRFLRLELGEVEEVEAPVDEVERQVDTDVELGSFEHRHEERRRRHLRRVARAVAEELERSPAEHVVLGGAEGDVAALERLLPGRVRGLVRGRFALPASDRQHELARAAEAVLRDARLRGRRTLVEELRSRTAEGAAAVVGLDATLGSLAARRARKLVLEEGFAAPGGRCPECGVLTAGVTCSRCGQPADAVDNVVDAAVMDAFADHVGLEFCDEGELVGMGRIGVLERR